MNADRAAGYETTIASEISRIIDNNNNLIMATGQVKTPVSVLKDDHYEELAFY